MSILSDKEIKQRCVTPILRYRTPVGTVIDTEDGNWHPMITPIIDHQVKTRQVRQYPEMSIPWATSSEYQEWLEEGNAGTKKEFEEFKERVKPLLIDICKAFLVIRP